MKTILHIDASPRAGRSLSRRLSARFVEAWLSRRPADRVLVRDLAAKPAPHLDEAWIRAAFTPAGERDAGMAAALQYSDDAIAELREAQLVVLGTPMYNYGMPSVLKAWVDQVIREGETFSFDLSRGDWPLAPTLSGKTLVVLSARGEFGFGPGGVRAAMNHLDPQISTIAPFLGVAPADLHSVTIEYQEFDDDRFMASVEAAHRAAEELAARLEATA